MPIGIRSGAGTVRAGYALTGGGTLMPHYYFDVKNGHRLIDPAGLECRDDQEFAARKDRKKRRPRAAIGTVFEYLRSCGEGRPEAANKRFG